MVGGSDTYYNTQGSTVMVMSRTKTLLLLTLKIIVCMYDVVGLNQPPCTSAASAWSVCVSPKQVAHTFVLFKSVTE